MTCAFAKLVLPTAAVEARPVCFVEPLFLFRSDSPAPGISITVDSIHMRRAELGSPGVRTVALCNRQTLTSFISDHLREVVDNQIVSARASSKSCSADAALTTQGDCSQNSRSPSTGHLCFNVSEHVGHSRVVDRFAGREGLILVGSDWAELQHDADLCGCVLCRLTVAYVASSLIYSLLIRPKYFSKLRNLPGPPAASLLFGNAEEIVRHDPSVAHTNWEKQYGHVYRYPFVMGRVSVQRFSSVFGH